MKTSQKTSRKLSIVVAVFILVLGVFIGGYLVLKSGSTGASQLDDILNGSTANLKNCQPNAGDSTLDSDNDGLKDWQEIQLYNSDPCKPDTDGDGYLDGEEVASGYSPTQKAPGDELPGTIPKTPRPLPSNLTQALSSLLAKNLSEGKIESFNKDGQVLSASELENYPALQQSVQEILFDAGQLFAPEPLADSQIKTTSDNSPLAIKKYLADAQKCFPPKQSAATGSQSETEMFLRALQSNDFSELDYHLQRYQTIYDNSKQLTVPTELAPLHKEILNIASSLIKVYQGIKEINNDPLKASLALQYYKALNNDLTNWFLKLGEFVKNHPLK